MSSATVRERPVPPPSEPVTGLTSELPRLRLGTVAVVALAAFGGGMAFIVPMVFTLALRVDELYPGRDYLLGFVLGAAAILGIASGPVAGMLSDRHRGRWGRRRPFMVASAVVGLLGLPILALAPNLQVLALGWLVASIGWNTVMSTVMFVVADRTPPSQRGQLTGLTMMAVQVSPVLGVPLVGMVAGNPWLMFAAPMLIGVVAVAVFCLVVREPDNRDAPEPAPITGRMIAGSFVFDPRRHPAFALAWSGRFLFFLAIGMTMTFQTFFYAQRLDVPVADIAPTMALISAVTLVPAMIGALGLGHLSDRIGRGTTVVGAAVVYAIGAVVQAFATTLPVLITGAILVALGFAAFGAVSQATVLDALPGIGRQTGRFLAISQFAQKLSGSIAPLVAPALMGLGGGEHANYTALLLVAGVAGLAGGGIMARAARLVRHG